MPLLSLDRILKIISTILSVLSAALAAFNGTQANSSEDSE